MSSSKVNVPYLIGLKFSVSAKGSAFLSFITRASMIGLSLGVMALVVVVSVMNGFDSQLKHRILGVVPHMVIEGEMPEEVKSSSEVLAYAEFLQRSGIVAEGGNNHMVAIYGIEPEKEAMLSVIPSHMKIGSINTLMKNDVIMGTALARRLGIWVGDSTTLLIPEVVESGDRVSPKIAKVRLAGTFELNSELDYSLVLMHIDLLRKITGDTKVEQRIKLKHFLQITKIKNTFAKDLEFRDWTEDYGDFFRTVKMEKLMMFVLLTFIVMIAAFNTISGLSMMVKDKQAEIAVLRTMGLLRSDVMKIFMFQGSLIGILGTFIGLIVGIPLAYHVTEVVGFFEDIFGTRMLAGTYFDRVPTDVRLGDIVVIVCLSLLISIVATILPAYRASQINPAQILRGE